MSTTNDPLQKAARDLITRMANKYANEVSRDGWDRERFENARIDYVQGFTAAMELVQESNELEAEQYAATKTQKPE